MKVLQVITDPERRGAQVFATDLGAALVRQGHTVTTVALGPAANADGVAPPARLDVPVLGRRRRSIQTARRLRARAADHDVVVAHGSTTLPMCALALAGRSTPFVYRQISDSLFWAPDRRRRARVRLALRRAARVVALAPGAADVLVDRFGVDRAHVRVVPNGVPVDGFGPADNDARRRARSDLGLPPDARVVLCASALVPEKGVDRVIAALSSGAALAPAVLLVAGDGPERAALEAQAERLLPKRARFAGVLAAPAQAYAAADVVVLASRGGDSMPATLIEAGLCGLPVVATPVGAIGEVVTDDVTGVLVPNDDEGTALARALSRLLVDPAGRHRLGAAARDRCLARFSIDVVADQWAAVLAEATSRR
jgi:glycosyltransferase involved in cell wall biosynthesis